MGSSGGRRPPMAPWGTFPPQPPPPGDATVGRGSARKAKRMIKNRESAARSRARKQAYTTQLEDEIKRLKERNLELKENLIPDEDLAPPPPPEKKPQRSSSVGF
ncbi:unnamed protein product [Spirodela intermedia]|uniref:BZIP domain-containing protein n=1 Tax=Spirodela intermedia TaxID=51605 RepID=A0A7I8IJ81_SPIIN|nr:unnamed protein product [Spirodela intermedia]CAA6657936.1 unnamed protein product [Spirodela intermedia]